MLAAALHAGCLPMQGGSQFPPPPEAAIDRVEDSCLNSAALPLAKVAFDSTCNRRPRTHLILRPFPSRNFRQIPPFRYDMKTLPIFTFALCLSAAATWGAICYRQTLAQDAADKQPAAATKPLADEQPSPDKPEKGVLRRNEASGTVALVTLEEAREKLISYQSVKAKIVETVAIGERRFTMKGNYLQGEGLKLRLDYEVEVGSTTGKLTEVCDGQILWSHQVIGKEQRVTRRNVRQIIEAAAAAEPTSETLLHAELGLGGLQGLLASIQKSVQFERQWEQDFDSQPFLVIDGGWKTEHRAKFLGPNADAKKPLPDFVPDRVRIYVQKDSKFPRRIMYLKRYESPSSAQKSLRPMVTIDFVDVDWNVPVDEAAFVFVLPENVERQDVTEEYLKLFEKGKKGAVGSGQ